MTSERTLVIHENRLELFTKGNVRIEVTGFPTDFPYTGTQVRFVDEKEARYGW